MQLYTDEWISLTTTQRDGLIAAEIAGPASMKALTELIYGSEFSESQYVNQTRAFRDLVAEGYVERTDNDNEHGNAKVHDITTEGRMLLDRNVIETWREVK